MVNQPASGCPGRAGPSRWPGLLGALAAGGSCARPWPRVRWPGPRPASGPAARGPSPSPRFASVARLLRVPARPRRRPNPARRPWPPGRAPRRLVTPAARRAARARPTRTHLQVQGPRPGAPAFTSTLHSRVTTTFASPPVFAALEQRAPSQRSHAPVGSAARWSQGGCGSAALGRAARAAGPISAA